MPRTPKVRLSYRADQAFLLRLAQAVEKDTAQSQKWKRAVLLHLTELGQLFTDAELARQKSEARA